MPIQMCGVAQSLGGDGQFCRWPEDRLRYCIRDQHPRMAKAIWEGEIEWALGVLSKKFQLEFERVDKEQDSHIAYTVDNLGGQGGTLADAYLVPCGVRKNNDFRSRVRVDALDNFDAEDRTQIAMTFDLGEVILHEDLHVMGLGHITTPGTIALLNPQYNPRISGLQPADVKEMLGIGYKLREVVVPPAPPTGGPGPATGKRPFTTALSPGQTYKARGYGVVVDYAG